MSLGQLGSFSEEVRSKPSPEVGLSRADLYGQGVIGHGLCPEGLPVFPRDVGSVILEKLALRLVSIDTIPFPDTETLVPRVFLPLRQ